MPLCPEIVILISVKIRSMKVFQMILKATMGIDVVWLSNIICRILRN